MEIMRPSLNEDLLRAETLVSKGSIPKMEIEDFICILQIEPQDSFMAMELAKRLVAQERVDEAHRLMTAIVRIDNRFETLFALGCLEYRMSLEDSAFAHLQSALLIAPDGASELFEVFKILGNIFVRRGDLDSAEDSYFKAYRLNPMSDVLHVNLGTLAIQRANWDEGAQKFRVALGLNPSNDKAWVGLAICHRMKGDFELAWGNLEAAIQYNPLNEAALQLFLDWGLSEGREGKVLEHIRDFLVEGGWSERLSLAFAWLSFRRGDHYLASLELERLLAINPGHTSALQLAEEMRAKC